MKMTAKADSERFQSGANQYAVYLETPEGRLRSDLAFANLQDFLPLQAKPSLCALDLGCGTGAVSYTHLDVYKRQVMELPRADLRYPYVHLPVAIRQKRNQLPVAR